MRPSILLTALLMVIATTTVGAGAQETPWQKILADRLAVYGGRNWIVIADAAYPAQSSEGVETVVADGSQIEVVKAVLAAIADTKVLDANVVTTAELQYVPESDAPGITAYRQNLSQLTGGHDGGVMAQDAALTKVDEASRSVRVLVIKTNSVLPYSSVFLRLTAAYWNAEAEKRLRESMPAGGK
jgi:L-fucose mutarotase/ribose pyranase (RbsD/FucU family)